MENPEITQDRVDISLSLYEQTGEVVYYTSERIYKLLADRFTGETILDIGCGIGWGAALLSQRNEVVAADKSKINIAFTKALYPWLETGVWDIAKDSYRKANIVTAINVVEHNKEYEEVFKNLIDSAKREVWISTPNRNSSRTSNGRPRNKYHVREFTPTEVLKLIGNYRIDIMDWRDLSILNKKTLVSPLVYRIYV